MLHTAVRCVVIVAAWSGAVLAAEPTDAERLAASLAKWTEAKAACGGNYRYRVIQSSFTGFRSETLVVVQANRVVERRYETVMPPQPGTIPAPKLEWVETGDEIGKHKGAAEPRTLDELYAVAKKLVESEVPAEHVRSLGLDKQGLLQHCFLRDRRIQDDAPLKGVAGLVLTLGAK